MHNDANQTDCSSWHPRTCSNGDLLLLYCVTIGPGVRPGVARILVQVTIYRRLLIGRDGHLDQSEAYDMS